MAVSYDEARKLFEKVAAILDKELSDDDFQKIAELLDGGNADGLLDKVNEILEKTHPEIFACNCPCTCDGDCKICVECNGD